MSESYRRCLNCAKQALYYVNPNTNVIHCPHCKFKLFSVPVGTKEMWGYIFIHDNILHKNCIVPVGLLIVMDGDEI